MALRPRADIGSALRKPASKGVNQGKGLYGPPQPIAPKPVSKPLLGPAQPSPTSVPGSVGTIGGAQVNATGQRLSGPPSPSPTPTRPARVPSVGGSGGVGAGPTGTISAMSIAGGAGAMGGEAAPAAPAMSEEDFLAQDAEFNDTRAGAEREYQNLLAQLASRRGEQELETGNTLRNLGWRNGGWDQQDKLGGYGQAFQNQLGDFASRGMLDSSLYGGALNDLNRGFGQQRDDINTSLQQFLTSQETDRSQAEGAKTAAITAAQRQALARMAAGLQ